VSQLIIFAGPNGSGKSTITKKIAETTFIGIYLNADDIEQQLKVSPSIDLSAYSISVSTKEFHDFVRSNTLLNKVCESYECTADSLVSNFSIQNNMLHFDSRFAISSYVSMFIVEFLRYKFIEKRIAFSFETVMSHESKLQLLEQAKESNFQIILYFVTTESPEININRVKIRVQQGGHNVDEAKIRSRYYRSLDLLYDAIKLSDLAYLFDNSGSASELWEATVIDGKELLLKTDDVPLWFQRYVLDKSK
jgi:predicted ABC-type ATPase